MLSVIIPTRELSGSLNATIRSLTPSLIQGRIELIIVFNCDEVPPYRWSEHVRVLHLPVPKSPYSARNLGVAAALSETDIAFLDASHIPTADWLEAGERALAEHGGLVAGQIRFVYGDDRPSAGELWDSVINLQQERSVARGRAKTGNIFVSRDAWTRLGPFREGVRSGEDVRWTSQATSNGLSLTYCADAVTDCPARRWRPLLRKAARVGAGQAARFRIPTRTLRCAALLVAPPAPGKLWRALQRAGDQPLAPMLVKLIVIGWLVQAAQALGLAFPTRFAHAD